MLKLRSQEKQVKLIKIDEERFQSYLTMKFKNACLIHFQNI
jgi:hypothetical protein